MPFGNTLGCGVGWGRCATWGHLRVLGILGTPCHLGTLCHLGTSWGGGKTGDTLPLRDTLGFRIYRGPHAIWGHLRVLGRLGTPCHPGTPWGAGDPLPLGGTLGCQVPPHWGANPGVGAPPHPAPPHSPPVWGCPHRVPPEALGHLRPAGAVPGGARGGPGRAPPPRGTQRPPAGRSYWGHLWGVCRGYLGASI